jgi:hypothetical protein
MKKTVLVTLSIIAICSLSFAATVSAYKTGYSLGNFQGTDITADGTMAAGEWSTDSFGDWLYDGWTKTASISIHTKFEFGGVPSIADQWCIEVLSDTTNDPGDTFTFSFCGATDYAATPQSADDVLVNYTRSGTTIYRGTGTGWAVDPAIVLGTNVVVSSSMASGHWVIELKFDKSGAIAGEAFDSGDRVAVYDASTGKTLMWPPYSDANQPSTYGLLDYTNAGGAGGTVPEGLTIGVMVALSSVAVAVSARYFRKQPKL